MSKCLGGRGTETMIGKEYFSRQAQILLRIARVTRDPKMVAGLASKAAELQSKHDDTPLVPDDSPATPDIQGPGTRT
jgi:hypothetical protein